MITTAKSTSIAAGLHCLLCRKAIDRENSVNTCLGQRICQKCEAGIVRNSLRLTKSDTERRHDRDYAKFLAGKLYPEIKVGHHGADGSTADARLKDSTKFYSINPPGRSLWVSAIPAARSPLASQPPASQPPAVAASIERPSAAPLAVEQSAALLPAAAPKRREPVNRMAVNRLPAGLGLPERYRQTA